MRFRRIGGPLLITVVVFLPLLACDSPVPKEGGSKGDSQKAPPDLLQAGAPVDLVSAFCLAEKACPVARIDFSDATQKAFLKSGWQGVERSPEGKPYCWTKAQSASVDVVRVDPRDLRVRLRLRAPDFLTSGPQSLEAAWNGQRIGMFSLDPGDHVLDLSIPKSVQWQGLNRMELIPGRAYLPRVMAKSPDTRSLGVCFHEIEFDPAGPSSPSGPPAQAEAESLVQSPGSTITYFPILPAQAKLAGSGRLRGPRDSLPSGARGRAAIALVDVMGREHLLWEASLAKLAQFPEVPFEADLKDLAGQNVALSFAFSLYGKHQSELSWFSSFQMEWRGPRIEGASRAPGASGARRKPWNVFIILFDALRPDDTEPYGSTRVHTPQMSRLAKQGAVLVNAHANACWTRPSAATFLTSLYPAAHRVLDLRDVLAEDVPRLPGILQSLGYRTCAVSNNVHVSPEFGLGGGFDRFLQIPALPGYEEGYRPKSGDTPSGRAAFVWDRAIGPFLKDAAGAPFFVYLHEQDPHTPYDPPDPYASLYAGASGGEAASRGARPDPAQEARFRHSRYQGEVAFMDGYLGWMLDRLDREGLTSNTLIVFMADHGEEFQEHGGWEHGATLYEEILRVPWILSLKGVIPMGIRPRVSACLIDLPPTILDLLGQETPPWMQGRSILPQLRAEGDEAPPPRAVFADMRMDQHSVQLGNWKLLRRWRESDDSMHWELFQLDKDPKESRNLWAEEPAMRAALRRMMDWHLRECAAAGRPEPVQVDPNRFSPAAVRDLKALGYL